MDAREEKLRMLSDLIDLAKADNNINEIERNFLVTIAEQMGLSPDDFTQAMRVENAGVIAKNETERIIQFHRMILLMNVDQESAIEEIEVIRKLALKMGLNPLAVNKVLRTMNNYPNKMLPPKVLIGIFKENFN